MQRDYIGYVGEACKNGMTPEEVRLLFNNIYEKANTRNGKKILRLFAKAIGGAKRKSPRNKTQTPVEEGLQNQTQIPPEQKVYQYIKN